MTRAHAAAPTSATKPAPAGTVNRSDSAKSFQDNVRAAVIDSEAKLGKLEPWQKKIFDEEVVPQAQKFVRDFTGTSAVVAVDAIRNYLRFYAPLAFHGEGQKAVAFVRSAFGCAGCDVGRERIEATVRQRLERRGFTVVPVPAEEGESAKGIRTVADRAIALAKAQGASAALAVLIEPVGVDNIDSAHADEKRYFVHSMLYLRDLDREEGKVEVLDPEPFEGHVARLLNDAFTELGMKLARAGEGGAPGATRNEVQVEITGLLDYLTFTHARDALAERLRNEGPLEERRLARGRATFALITGKTSEVIRKQLAGDLNLESATIGPRRDAVQGDVIQLELHR